MNETSATSQPGATLLPDGTGVITTVHLVLMLIVALAAIAIIVVGARRKRIRKAAERQVVENAREAGVEPTPPDSVDDDVAPAVPASRQAQVQTQGVVTPPPPPLSSPVVEPVAAEPAPLADEPPLADELIAAAAPFDASPATIAADIPASPVATGEAPVTTLKGLGPKVAARLAELGITNVGQLAALSDGEATALDAELGAFSGRLARDRWIEQARLLAAGDRAGFEAAFGRL